MVVINEGGKSPNHVSSEEQVSQGVKNSAKILVANMENDESITIDNEVQFEIPPSEVGFLTKLTHEVRFEIGLTKIVLHPNRQRVW